ncbi:MAG: SH3 domain-containing protein [Phototrophicales bacterium]|nr:SH3 domain-containing protein [Phototrophicales bacterium]
MMTSNLLLMMVAGIFALLYSVMGGIRAIKKNGTIGFIDLLLIFLIALLPLVAVVMDNQTSTEFSTIEVMSLWLGGALVVSGLVIALLELRRPQRLKQSRGILGMGAGILLLVMTLITFLTARMEAQVAIAQLPMPTATLSVEKTDAVVVTHTPTITATAPPSVTYTAMVTRTPIRLATSEPLATFLLTPTRTPNPNQTPTAIPNTPAPIIPCLIVMNFNVNLRETPTADGRIIISIPFETTVFGISRSEDSLWWEVEYENFRGWVFGEVVTVTSTCRELPIVAD